jgi:hypothetical protein
MIGNKTCSGDQCADRYPGEKFSHPAVCRDKTHIVRGDVGKCLLFNFWPKNARRGALSKNSNGYSTQRHASGGHPWKNSKNNNNSNGPKGGGNAPRAPRQQQQQQRDSKAEVQLKALKAEFAEMRAQMSLSRAEAWPPLGQPKAANLLVEPIGTKDDKLAEAIRMMAEQLAVIASMRQN